MSEAPNRLSVITQELTQEVYSFNSSANLVYASISLVCNGELNIYIIRRSKIRPWYTFRE